MNKHPLQDQIDNFSNLDRTQQYNLYFEFLQGMLIQFFADAIEFDHTAPKMPIEEYSIKFQEFTRFWLKCRLKPRPDNVKGRGNEKKEVCN